MRILLIQSYLGRREKPIYPLGLAYLSAVLKEYNIRIIDPNILSNPLKSVYDNSRDFAPEIVGISLRNVDTTQIRDPFVYFNGFMDTLQAVKDALPQAKIAVGGSGFSIYAKEIMAKCPTIDYGVFLEGEETFKELVENIHQGEKVKGLFIRKDGEIVFSGERIFSDFKTLPTPDWSAFPPTPYRDLLDSVGVQTKRGCALKCAYCNYPFLNGNRYRTLPAETVGEEVEKLYRDYGVQRFIFTDSIFNLPRGHCEAVLNELVKRELPVKWTGWFNERGLDKELIELALTAGCEFFSFSPDGFSDRTLVELGKNLRNKDIIKTFHLLKPYPQAKVGFNFFINPPGQTLLDFLKMLWFALKVKRTFGHRVVGILLGSIRIEPDTPIYARALKEGIITEKTRMLVSNSEELLKLFYKPPKSWVLTMMLNLYIWLWKLKSNFRKE